MQSRSERWLAAAILTSLAIVGCSNDSLEPAKEAAPPSALAPASVVAAMYAPDFVATAATGYDLNDAGDVVGRSYTDTGCGPFCLGRKRSSCGGAATGSCCPMCRGHSAATSIPYSSTTRA